MTSGETVGAEAEVFVENIGGIDNATVQLQRGTNILVGHNATNRTSFLNAIMAALGSNEVSMKGDADEATASLECQGDRFYRDFSREGERLSKSGDPYLDDPVLADLFAFLLESNEARRTISTEGNLREILMRPVDLQAIRAEIAELEERRRQIDEDIEAIDAQKADLPALESRREELSEEITDVRTELEAKEDEIDAADADIEARREEKRELEATLETLREARGDLDDVRYEIEGERESIQSLKQERSTLREELDSLSVPDASKIEDIDSQIERLRETRRRIDTQINSLQSTIQFNEEMLAGERTDLTEKLSDQSDITEDLLPDEEIRCWTCGSEVERERIETTIDELRTLRQEKIDEKRDQSETLEELQKTKQSLRQDEQRKQELERQLTNCDSELDRRNERLQNLQDRRSDLEATVRNVEEELENLESDQFDDVLDLHREANELEYELGRLENELESVESDIEAIEERLSKRSELEAEREDINEELQERRTRIEKTEKEAIDEFNNHMDEVLDAFNYDNIDRIWIERVQREVREGREKNLKTFFEMHVVRTTTGGTTYEDSIEHLSESEREVTGLVFALAGYLAHDVHDEVPFMLLDSLEAIDSHRIAELVDYFADFPAYLVVALLPEDAQELSDEYHRITEIS